MRPISAVCLLMLLGCGTDPDAFSRCDSNIAVTVSHEAVPQFSWSPADCGMHELNVTEDNQVQWLINTVDGNGLSSPLRYGEEPPGTPVGAEPLHTGFFYTVDIWRLDDAGLPRRVVSHRFQHQVD